MQNLCDPERSAKGNTHRGNDKRENLRITKGDWNTGANATLTFFPV